MSSCKKLAYIYRLIKKNQGSISVSHFMNAVLYHKRYGYYMNKSPLGGKGDFTTAPEISQLFGEIVAIWVMYIWEKLGKPIKFSIVELGPGNGTLIKDIIRVTKKYSNNYCDSVLIYLIEVSPVLKKIQKKKLKGLGVNIKWKKTINNLPKQPTVFLANEFFDALPIDQFLYLDEQWYENRIVKLNNKASFKESKIPLSNSLELKSIKTELSISALLDIYIKKNKKLFNGAVLEICKSGIKILRKLERKIYNNKGAALIIDYGYVYSEYKSTLQSVKKHQYTYFLKNICNSDITSLVNFQVLKDSLKYLSCEIFTQREFLYLFGIRERTKVLMKNATSYEQKNKIFSEFLRLTENMGTLFKAMLIKHL